MARRPLRLKKRRSLRAWLECQLTGIHVRRPRPTTADYVLVNASSRSVSRSSGPGLQVQKRCRRWWWNSTVLHSTNSTLSDLTSLSLSVSLSLSLCPPLDNHEIYHKISLNFNIQQSWTLTKLKLKIKKRIFFFFFFFFFLLLPRTHGKQHAVRVSLAA